MILEIHGDWRTATRLYGSGARELLAPARRPGRARGGSAGRRRADDLELHDRPRPRGRRRAGGDVPGVHGPRRRSWGRPTPLPGRAGERSSSACSSATRTSTGSRPRGGSPRRGCRTRSRSGSSGQAAAREVVECARARPARSDRDGRRQCRTTRSPALLDAATALVLPSRSEGLGRIVVEALCRGRPVVATRVGGITDLVRDGENGLLVEPRSPAALADALVRVLADGELAERLAAAARPSVELVARDARGLRAPDARARRAGARGEPPACPLRRARRATTLPLSPGLERKWAAIGAGARLPCPRPRHSGTTIARFELVGGSFYARAARPRRGALSATFRPQAIVAEDPRTAALVIAGRPGVPVIAEVHGNWRHSTRLYGSPARRALSPLVDRLDEYGVRHADAVRALSGYTAGLVEAARGRPPDAVFPTYSDLSAFTALPGRAAAGAAGGAVRRRARAVQERRRAAEAWRLASPQVPEATLVDRRARARAGGRRAARRRRARRARARALARGGRRGSSTSRRCSCCRRATRASAAS